MKKNAVIFDLDGTLLDTLDDIAFAMNSALETLGAPPHAVPKYRAFVGQGLEKLAFQVLPENMRDDATVNKSVSLMRSVYADCWARSTKPYPGIINLLERVRSSGTAMAVLSNKAEDFARKTVEHFFGPDMFFMVAGSCDRFPNKPDPAYAVHIATLLAVKPADCFFIGDSDVDMRTAVNAGMIPLGVTWGFRTREELLANGAKFLADSADEVMKIVM